ncbi:MAG: hypothetical protein KAU10_08000, partial [Dehalococcoidia bacterium]|nr:hypothetical protein [Dehalococcoidia bacterium]
SSFGTLDSIFDGFLQGGAWVPPGAKTRSVGTLSPIAAARVELAEYGGKLKYRLTFEDSSGSSFTRPVSDLAFRELCYAEIRRHTRSCKDVAQELSGLLEGATRIYLRLGLARPWLNPKLGQAGCYLQVTGIHTFPDYLQGKSFADFQS